MKKTVSIFLLTVFSFHIVGFSLLFFAEKKQLRNEMIQRIRNGSFDAALTEITILPKDKHLIQWREADEFSYKGSLYDVVLTKSTTDGATIYSCITDVNEMKLLAKLRKDLSKDSNKNRTSTNKVSLKYLTRTTDVYTNEEETFLLSKLILPNYVSSYTTRNQEVTSPPPKRFL